MKNLASKKEDADLRQAELVMYLLLEIGDREKKEIHGERHRQRVPRLNSDQALTPSKAQGDDDDMGLVRVLQLVHRARKVNRRGVVDGARKRAMELGHGFAECPVLAVDLKDEVLDLIRTTQLRGPDAWKNVNQTAATNERKYLSQLQEELEALEQGKKHKYCFIYNLRTDNIIFYYLF